MRTIIFIDEKILNNYQSNLFPLFSPKIADHFIVTASFKDYQPALFPIFTDLSNYVSKVISERGIEDYGLVLDAQKIKVDEVGRHIIRGSRFIFILGPGNGDQIKHNGLIQASCLYNPQTMADEQVASELVLSELEVLDQAYEEVAATQSFPASIHVLCPPRSAASDQWPSLRRWRQKFSDLKIRLFYHWPNRALYDYLVGQQPRFLGRPTYPLSLDLGQLEVSDSPGQPMSVDDFCQALKDLAAQPPTGRRDRASKVINIICYQPSYLFKDLVDRFVARGCVHSDFPRSEAGAYIWMRPQELWHLDFALKGLANSEIPGAYAKAAPLATKGLDVNQLGSRSVAIHHGTCYEPIYQFCPYKLAHSLRSVARVVGVCEFEECYGPAVEAASRDNFDFRPIGYDHRLFTEDLIQRETKLPDARLRIGFVGRAYGTSNPEQLNKSRLAEPRGYRKGGDALLAVATRLKLAGLDFELHILGNNWDDLVEQLKAGGIAVRYQVRDQDLSYRDYPELYRHLDLLLITSRCEGGPVSVLEALSLGVKVVGSRVGLVRALEGKLQGTESLFTYEYDRKWMLFELDRAMDHLRHIYMSAITYHDRLKTRSLIEELTTERWVDHII